MSANKEKRVWVIGHKNPDTDSICSAIAYANLKNIVEGDRFAPKRAGEINQETRFVLERFGVEEPEFEADAGSQVKDIEIRNTPGVNGNISLKRAWEMMKELNVVTLPITNDKGYLEGLIVTQDIATSYMDVYDPDILARANTTYKNIIDTLDGEIVCGDENACFEGTKVLVGSANPEIMESYIEPMDMVLMGNRYDAQICALESGAGCIIVAGEPKLTKTIVHMANEKGCTLITTGYDTYTAARLINQSMPVNYFMKKDNLVKFYMEDFIDDVKQIMSKVRFRDFPILDDNHKYIGMFSRRNLLNMKKKPLILVDHNERSQAVDGITGADILEIIDHHRIGNLETLAPVYFRNQPVGCTATIIYQMYREQNVEITPQIAGLLCSAIISDTLLYRSPTCTPLDKMVAEELAQIAGIETETYAKEMFRAGSDLGSKTAEEILEQDFKVFNQNDIDFGVGQISAMTREELGQAKEKLLPYLGKAMVDNNISMIFVMLTNIIDETTYLICAGEGADELVENAYHVAKEGDIHVLKGVVSRKKQLIPSFIAAIQAQ